MSRLLRALLVLLALAPLAQCALSWSALPPDVTLRLRSWGDVQVSRTVACALTVALGLLTGGLFLRAIRDLRRSDGADAGVSVPYPGWWLAPERRVATIERLAAMYAGMGCVGCVADRAARRSRRVLANPGGFSPRSSSTPSGGSDRRSSSARTSGR